MKKLFVLLLLLFTTDSFASGIASNTNSAPCTNNTLETYSGNSNLAADWQPNEIQLRWYNGNTLLNVQSSANTCVYDSTLTIPQTAPTRTGYTFDGWTVRPEINFATTIPINPNGVEGWAKGVSSNESDTCWYFDYAKIDGMGENTCNNDAPYKELQQFEWKVTYEHGTLYGMAGCSPTNIPGGTIGDPVTLGSGYYCYCKATGYKTTNANVISSPSVALSWVSLGSQGNDSNCASICASRCAYYAGTANYVRQPLFTPANN